MADVALIVLAVAWLVAVGVAALRAGRAGLRLRRTMAAGGAERLEALVALDRRRDRLTEKRSVLEANVLSLNETVAGAQRGVRVLAILADALEQARRLR
jgi:hypothetical protein